MTNGEQMAYPAFDSRGDCGHDTTGLTKREFFAAMAMQGLLASPEASGVIVAITRGAVALADALITALNTTQQQDNG